MACEKLTLKRLFVVLWMMHKTATWQQYVSSPAPATIRRTAGLFWGRLCSKYAARWATSHACRPTKDAWSAKLSENLILEQTNLLFKLTVIMSFAGVFVFLKDCKKIIWSFLHCLFSVEEISSSVRFIDSDAFELYFSFDCYQVNIIQGMYFIDQIFNSIQFHLQFV